MGGAPEVQCRRTQEQIFAEEDIFTVDGEVLQRKGCGWLAKAEATARVDMHTAPRQCCGFSFSMV